MNRLLYHSLAFYLSLSAVSAASSSPKESPAPLPCTIRSPTSHAFFDLRPLHLEDPATSKAKHPRTNSWNASGYDIGYNFTMNFCGGVLEDLEERGGVVGVEKSQWKNISAFYEMGGKVYSLGQENHTPIFRGRKLVLNYTDGSPCGPDAPKASHKVEDLRLREIIGGDDDDDDDDDDKKEGSGKNKKPSDDKEEDKRPAKKPTGNIRRKNTIISFLCDREPLNPLLTLSFVGSDPDQCTYMFEARTSAGCGGIEVAKQTLSPVGVFGVIVLIGIIVYLVGGCVYSRMVLHQRGWQQLPNYGLWSSIFGFFKDLVIIMTSSCTRFLPSRRGYQRVNGNLNGSGFGRGRGRGDSDAENRLIDELNEEWDD